MGLPAERLTEKQATYVRKIAEGLTPKDAARLAGYNHPEIDAYRVRALPHISAAIRTEIMRRVDGEMAPLAWRTLHELLSDKQTGPVRLGAAKTILDRAGYVENPNKNNGMDKPLGEMTAEELLAKAGEIRGRLAAREAVSAPNSAPILDASPSEAQEA